MLTEGGPHLDVTQHRNARSQRIPESHDFHSRHEIGDRDVFLRTGSDKTGRSY